MKLNIMFLRRDKIKHTVKLKVNTIINGPDVEVSMVGYLKWAEAADHIKVKITLCAFMTSLRQRSIKYEILYFNPQKLLMKGHMKLQESAGFLLGWVHGVFTFFGKLPHTLLWLILTSETKPSPLLVIFIHFAKC